MCTNPRTQFGCTPLNGLSRDEKAYESRVDCFDNTPCGGDPLNPGRVQMYASNSPSGTELFKAALGNVREIKNVFQLMDRAISDKNIPLLSRIIPGFIRSKMYSPWFYMTEDELLSGLLALPESFTDVGDYVGVVKDAGEPFMYKHVDVVRFLRSKGKSNELVNLPANLQRTLAFLIAVLSQTMAEDDEFVEFVESLVETPGFFGKIKSDELGHVVMDLAGSDYIEDESSVSDLADTILTRSDNPTTQDVFLDMVGEELFGIAPIEQGLPGQVP